MTDKARAKGRKVEGVGVMKDKVRKLEEIEASHTLGEVGEGRVQGRGKWRVWVDSYWAGDTDIQKGKIVFLFCFPPLPPSL
jgi:hypothetical protein